jgi:hypothetical protein
MVTLIRYSWTAFILLFFMLGSTPSLRAEAPDFIAKNSHRCGSESCRRDHPPQTIATTGRIVTISATGRTMRVSNSSKSTSTVKNVYEYTIVTTGDTVFQDGVDAIRFEDFKSGETISIHGVLKGTTLTASRLAKWE